MRPTIPALATLAYDPRRATLFRKELFSALEIVNRGDIELERLKGSWAGALGQPQFMPSTYLEFAQDFDGDGRRDIWSSQADVFASVAHYLKEHGWSDTATWGREVKVAKAAKPKSTPSRADPRAAVPNARSPSRCRSRSGRKLGVRTTAGTALPAGALEASMVTDGARYFLVYKQLRGAARLQLRHELRHQHRDAVGPV